MTVLCRLMGVSRSGFYDYLRRQDRDPDPEHEEKLEWVKDLAEAFRQNSDAMQSLAEGQARRAGATDVQVQTQREDHVVHLQGEDVYFDTEVKAIAVGRPKLANG